MNIEEIRDYCLSFKATSECLPFDDDTLVFKVDSKMFALVNLTGPTNLNLKCQPHKAIELRERYPDVTPGYHMNKTHWNTVMIRGTISETLIKDWIAESYNLVFSSLPKKRQQAIISNETS